MSAISTLLTLNLARPRNRATAGGSNGCRAALVRRRLTPGPISSLPGTAGSPPSTSSSISYRKLDLPWAITTAPAHGPTWRRYLDRGMRKYAGNGSP